jgi:hypothetical protein
MLLYLQHETDQDNDQPHCDSSRGTFEQHVGS